MQRFMLDVNLKSPFGLGKKSWPLFAGAMLVLLVLLAAIDGGVTRQVAALPDIVRAPFYVITRAGNSDWILYPTLLVSALGLVAGALWPRGPVRMRIFTVASVAFFIFAAVALPGLIANLVKRLVGRARPVNFDQYGNLHFEPFRDWAFQSFPSGDTTTIFALAFALSFLVPRYRWWFMLGAALVGISRVMVGMHFPTDVLGGFLLGAFGAYGVRHICTARGWLFRHETENRVVFNPAWPPRGS